MPESPMCNSVRINEKEPAAGALRAKFASPNLSAKIANCAILCYMILAISSRNIKKQVETRIRRKKREQYNKNYDGKT